MTTGGLIRQARLLARLSQTELAERVGRDRAHIARWERDAVEPGFSTLRAVLQACGYDLSTALIRYDTTAQDELRPLQNLTPSERLERMLSRVERDETS